MIRLRGQASHILAVLTCVLLALAVTPSAEATPLPPSTTVFNPDVGGGGPFFSVGPIPAAYSTSVIGPTTFPFAGAFTGRTVSQVFADGSGQLAFTYQFFHDVNVSVVEPEIIRATINDLTNLWTGVTIFDAGVVPSTGASTAAVGSPNWTDGDPNFILRPLTTQNPDIQFRAADVGTYLTEGDSSSLIWFTTDAKFFKITDVGLADGGAVGTSSAYGPNAAIPEPSTLVLSAIGVGCGLVTLWRRRRSK